MITFAVERLSDELENLIPFFPEHWKELALNQDKVPLDPQYDVYLDREAQGQVMFICGRTEGKIVAYFVGFVAPALHYKTCLTLQMDIFYVKPGARGAMAGVRLFKFVEAEARSRGVQRMFVGSKMHKDASWLFERLQFTEVEKFYSKWLGE